MSLNRHNPFVASLSTLVEPAPADTTASPEVATSAGPAEANHPTFIERIENWAAFGQTFGASAPEAPPATALDEAEIVARAHKLFPYYY